MKPKQINRIRDIAKVNGWIPQDQTKFVTVELINMEIDHQRHMVILDPTVDDKKVEKALKLVKALIALGLIIQKQI